MIRISALIIIILFLISVTRTIADPPPPPSGKHWEKVEVLSDEFNDTWVDGNKWYKYNPKWVGRDPGRFKPEQVSESGGYLRLKNTQVAPTNQRVWVHTGFLASKKQNFVAGMYSECRMKVAKDGTVSGFWMSGYMTEIDVQEAVGWPANGNSNMTKQMRMNTHYHAPNWSWDYPTPANHSIDSGVGDAFHTYGVWWKDKRNITMYYGDGSGVATDFYTKGDFTVGMQLNIDTECQNWIGDPNVSYLNDDSRNTKYVDYVRTWRLKDGGTPIVNKDNQLSSLNNLSGKGKIEVYDIRGRIIQTIPVDFSDTNTGVKQTLRNQTDRFSEGLSIYRYTVDNKIITYKKVKLH